MSDVSGSAVPESTRLHQALVDQLVQRGYITTPLIEAAFRAVPRHLFVPDVPIDRVYQDQYIPTKYEHKQLVSSSSQPAIMAIMLDQLALAPGQRVLEIGAGTGYNAALMAHLVGPGGHVVTLDLDDDLVCTARAHLSAAGLETVDVIQHDGALGYALLAPYDRIILTVASWDIVPAWTAQLARNGRLVLPLMLFPGLTLTVAFDWRGDQLQSVSAYPCGFLPLRGELAYPPARDWIAPQISVAPHPSVQPPESLTCALEKAWSTMTVTWSLATPASDAA